MLIRASVIGNSSLIKIESEDKKLVVEYRKEINLQSAFRIAVENFIEKFGFVVKNKDEWVVEEYLLACYYHV
jgi:hypothetical protein